MVSSIRSAKKKETEKEKAQQEVEIQGHGFPSPFASFSALLVLCAFFGSSLLLVRRSMYFAHVDPLPPHAPLHRFSEGRAMQHIVHLAHEIGIRQEGSVGLVEASNYLQSELQAYKKLSSKNMRVEVDTSSVNGSFHMTFLQHNIALAYRNHTNIAIRISAANADDDAPAVLVNGHFDSAIGSPGAGDCASCVATMLEAVRLIIDSDWVPPKPIIFLFNGAEEIFMVAAHGFMTTHKWKSTVGAVINLEASGTGGPDLVCQSGPGSWPAEVYAEAAIYPMANTAAQDIFPHIPGDTDYRMFSEDYGDIPGLDIILLLEGYVYHTPYDVPERMVPGSMQVRGENLMSLLKSFTHSQDLRNSSDRMQLKSQMSKNTDKKAVFFDFLGWFMVYYSFNTAVALHTLPLGFVLIVASLTDYETSGSQQFSGRIASILKGAVLHILESVLGVIFPVAFAIVRLLPASTAMTWFAHPWLACLIYAPISFGGILLPRACSIELMYHGFNNKKSVEWGLWWGAVLVHSLLASVGTHSIGNGCIPFCWVVSLLAAHYMFHIFQNTFGKRSILTFSLYIFTLAVPILLTLYSEVIIWLVLQEKMGMSGSVPQPYGFFVPDVIMAAITGLAVAQSVGPLVPIIGRWLSSWHIIKFLLCLSVISSMASSQLFPYSSTAPKRVLLQHTIETKGNEVLQSHYDLAVLDANSLPFVFKHVPAISNHIMGLSSFDTNTASRSPGDTWMGLYPISCLFTESFRFPAKSTNILENHPHLPHIIVRHVEPDKVLGIQRTYVELDLGSLNEVWAAVLNITGPLLNWSFSNQELPAPEIVNGGPLSYICRLTGSSAHENWKFWLEAKQAHVLRVDLAVLDQKLEKETQEFLNIFPSWAATIAASTYSSSYTI